MEYIDKIFYRKINPSDFKKMYDIDLPTSGGGQTYLEAAGIQDAAIIDFLSFAEISESSLSEEVRPIFTFTAYVLGHGVNDKAPIEFAPRKGRNYRISRQNLAHKHPAWKVENGFPEPNKNARGQYTSEGNFDGIIDNLVIVILRTTFHKYYAWFINSPQAPEDWPKGIGLERIFEGERRGVLSLSSANVEFKNSATCPFGSLTKRIENGTNTLLYGVPGSGKSWIIEHEYCTAETIVERVVFHPDYTNSDFIGQILPVVDSGSDSDQKLVTYEFTPGPFTKILREAVLNPGQKYILIIEEINRGNAAAIFGDIFQLLDRTVVECAFDNIAYPPGTSEYGITNANIADFVYGDKNKKIRIPSNLTIIGTMNTSDQNVYTLDTAFQRRWRMRLIENNFNNVRPSLGDAEILDTGISWKKFCETINQIIVGNKVKMASAEDKRLGVYFIHESDLQVDKNGFPKDGYDDICEELIALVKKERDNNITPDEKARLSEVRIALMQNRRFAEKVLKYLWDDAFKFNPEVLFDIERMESLEKVIYTFVNSKERERFKIFTEQVFQRLYPTEQP